MHEIKKLEFLQINEKLSIFPTTPPNTRKNKISIFKTFKLMIVLSTPTPIKHHNNKPFMEILYPKCDKNKCQILKLQNENETKNKYISI